MTPTTAVSAKYFDNQVRGGHIGLRGEVELSRAKVYHLEIKVDWLGQENISVKRSATYIMSRLEEQTDLL